MKLKIISLSIIFFLGSLFVKADEGMWIPLLIGKLNIDTMQAMGCKLSAEDIYSMNKPSIKDAVVTLDKGSCTAEFISAEGLLLTNHHCGYEEIQSHSSLEHDYLTNGFWAKDKSEELVNPEKTVSVLIRIEDVTEKITNELTDKMSESERKAKIQEISNELTNKAIGLSHYEASVEHFFKGNQFFLFVYETFKDVRLVGTPPNSIGKFGGDTDNWMWPRHTGDFMLFRVYCGKDGKPADYDEENVPYRPKHHLPISLKGIQEDDFVMILGFPGTTKRYLTSWGVNETMQHENDIRVKIRTEKLAIIKKDMSEDDKIRIQYAAKYSQSSNYWKYSIGQNKGLNALNVIDRKQEIEKDFIAWVKEDDVRKKQYGQALPFIRDAYIERVELDKTLNYFFEALWMGPEILRFAAKFRDLEELLTNPDYQDQIEEISEMIVEDEKKHFKDYSPSTDQKVLSAMLKIYAENVDEDYHPELFKKINKKYKGDFDKYVAKVFKKSFFASQEAFEKYFEKPKYKKLINDPAYVLMKSALDVYFKISPEIERIENKLSKGQRLFIAGLMKMYPDKTFYPDANSTMRLTYGTVGGYKAKDAVAFKHYTKLSGVMQKEDPNNDEFIVDGRLKELYNEKDYGQYGTYTESDTTMYVCFISNNDITGGNSGSPVLNGNGELVGIAFDGNWEAMSGDIAFETKLQRTISTDIRYVLFVIDKFAKAKHLIDEMTIVK